METRPTTLLPNIYYPFCAALLWGGMYVASKFGLGTVPPITLTAMRFILGVVALTAGLTLVRESLRLPRRDWPALVELGFWADLAIIAQFWGTDLTTASEGAVLTSVTPLLTVVAAGVLLHERLSRQQWLGIGVATLGILGVVVDPGRPLALTNLVGDLILLLAAAGWAVYTVRGKPVVQRHSALKANLYAIAVGFVLLLPLVAWELSWRPLAPISLPTWGAIVYLGVGATALAWFLWYKGVERLPVAVVAVAFFAQPIFGALLGHWLLSEALRPGFLAGGAVTLIGILLVSVETRQRETPHSARVS